jgi:hypothetical protein
LAIARGICLPQGRLHGNLPGVARFFYLGVSTHFGFGGFVKKKLKNFVLLSNSVVSSNVFVTQCFLFSFIFVLFLVRVFFYA